jgi:hypothetical protein
MPQILVAGATIQCTHGGIASLSGGDPRLSISGNGTITSGMEVGISFAPGSPAVASPCPFTDPKSGSRSPCSATVAATAGISTQLSVGNAPALLDQATGLVTNPSDPSAKWSVASAGQTLLGVNS